MKFQNICKVKKQLVQPGLVWIRTLSILLSMNGESVSLLCSHNGPTLQFYCKQNRQLYEMSAKVSEM